MSSLSELSLPPPKRAAIPARPRVLVVDDDLFLARLIVRAIEAEVEAVEAYDGLTALDLVDRERPDLILLDYHLPRLMGDEVCRRIRQRRPPPEIRIVILTGCSSEFGPEQARAAGADGYLLKPFSPRAVVDVVRGLAAQPAQPMR